MPACRQLHWTEQEHLQVQYLVWCTKVGSLADAADVINKSAECNFAQLVSGTTVAPTHDWSDYFATRMKKLVSIKKLHDFKISSFLAQCL